jgi:hypothetical protein
VEFVARLSAPVILIGLIHINNFISKLYDPASGIPRATTIITTVTTKTSARYRNKPGLFHPTLRPGLGQPQFSMVGIA